MLFVFLLFFSVASCEKEQHWIIQLDTEHASPQAFAHEHGLQYEKRLDFLSDATDKVAYYSFKDASSHRQQRNAMAFRDVPGVQWAKLQEPRMQYIRSKRSPDPLYEQQWHLHSHQFGVDADFVPNVTGYGVVIGIVDDGLQHAHPDLQNNYVARLSHDFNGNSDDPTPRDSRDGHGTCAAGVAVGVANNGHCGRGVAYQAKVAGLRTIAGPVSDATESEALTYNGYSDIDIYSCSWGPEDSGRIFGEVGHLTHLALSRAVNMRLGRRGLGSIYVWAAGNGRTNGDSCAFDGYVNSPFVFAIGALDHEGKRSWYSEACSNLLAVAPSSGAGQGITTIDLMGSAGYTPTECTSTFGGTSSSAPLAAGIIACILQERPDLTWRDVKHVIAKGATLVDPTHTGWNHNVRNYRHSNEYGFGLLKLPSLMQAARRHKLVPDTERVIMLDLVTFPRGTGVMPFLHAITVPEGKAKGMTFIEHVVLRVSILHSHRGHVNVEMTSPEGVTSLLSPPRPHDDGENFPLPYWSLSTLRHWGESHVAGDWVVNVTDVTGAHAQGTVTGLQFILFGY